MLRDVKRGRMTNLRVISLLTDSNKDKMRISPDFRDTIHTNDATNLTLRVRWWIGYDDMSWHG